MAAKEETKTMPELAPGPLFLWRHPVETVGATKRAAATGNTYFRKPGMPLRSLLGSRVLKRQCDAIIAAGASVEQVQYGDLVSRTAAVMRSLCQFLQIPYDPRLATLEGADRSAVYEGKHHSLLRQDVIVAGPRPDVLDPGLRAKIDHYLTLWRESDARERRTISRGPTPSFAQRRLDQLRTVCIVPWTRAPERLFVSCPSPCCACIARPRHMPEKPRRSATPGRQFQPGNCGGMNSRG
jgi:hypothetical protein